MKNKILLFVGFLALFLSILLINIISAQEIVITPDNGFNLISWFTHIFGIQKFSVVGDSQTCGNNGNPNYAWSVGSNQNFMTGTVLSGSRPSSIPSNSLIDIFTNGWTPFIEQKSINSPYNTCGTGPCNIQIYTCPHPECSGDSNCQSWIGTYSICKTASCTSWGVGYKCTANGITEGNIPYYTSSFKYCTNNVGVTCYYYAGSGTSCTPRVYSGVTSCPSSYQGQTLYSSKSTCESNIPPPSCETMSGTSGRCDSNSITDKKCVGNLVYVCSDYGTAGKCWTNMADCSLSGKICENGECKSTCISLIQLRTYADQWINNQIDRNTLGNYIQNWASCN